MRDAKRLVTVSLCSFERLVMNELLKTEHLSVSFFTDAGEVEAVRDVSFTVRKGEVLAIVGESGCGKSALCKSIMKLLPKTAKIKSGKILGERSGYYRLYGKKYVEAEGRTVLYGFSGSDDISESDDHGGKTDRRGGADP